MNQIRSVHLPTIELAQKKFRDSLLTNIHLRNDKFRDNLIESFQKQFQKILESEFNRSYYPNPLTPSKIANIIWTINAIFCKEFGLEKMKYYLPALIYSFVPEESEEFTTEVKKNLQDQMKIGLNYYTSIILNNVSLI